MVQANVNISSERVDSTVFHYVNTQVKPTMFQNNINNTGSIQSYPADV